MTELEDARRMIAALEADARRMIAALEAELAALKAADIDELTDKDRAVFSWSFTGKHVHLFDARPHEIELRDIARGLAMHYRYNGHTCEPYTVAEHSVIVSGCVDPRFARQALMHDAAEAYIGDMCSPMKYRPRMRAFIEAKLEAVIFERFGIVRTPESDAAVAEIDRRILCDEVAQLIPTADAAGVRAKCGPPLDVNIACLDWRHAEYIFVSRFIELFPGWSG